MRDPTVGAHPAQARLERFAHPPDGQLSNGGGPATEHRAHMRMRASTTPPPTPKPAFCMVAVLCGMVAMLRKPTAHPPDEQLADCGGPRQHHDGGQRLGVARHKAAARQDEKAQWV